MRIPTLPPTQELPPMHTFDVCVRGETSAKTGCTPASGEGGIKSSKVGQAYADVRGAISAQMDKAPEPLKKIGRAAWAIWTFMPKVSRAVVRETGVSERTAHIAYVIANLGDLAPGPWGSSAVLIAATIRNPVAPIAAGRKALAAAREALKKRKLARAGAGAEMQEEDSDLKRIAQAIESKTNREWFVQLLATAMEEESSVTDAIEVAEEAIKLEPEPPKE